MTTTMSVSIWDTEFTITITEQILKDMARILVHDGTLHWVEGSDPYDFWHTLGPQAALSSSVSPDTYAHFLVTGPLNPEDPASYLRFLGEMDPLDISSPNRAHSY